MTTIVQVETEAHIRQARALFEEYFEYLRTDVDDTADDWDEIAPMAGYRDELATLPGRYAPPEGRLLLALYGAEAAGCVAFYRLDKHTCELKRLWTRPQFRGKRVGRALVERLIGEARQAGYRTMLLSTLPVLKEAVALYTSLGFEATAPFFDLPPELLANEIFLKLTL